MEHQLYATPTPPNNSLYPNEIKWSHLTIKSTPAKIHKFLRILHHHPPTSRYFGIDEQLSPRPLQQGTSCYQRLIITSLKKLSRVLAASSRAPRVNLKSWRRPHVGEPAVLSRRKTLKTRRRALWTAREAWRRVAEATVYVNFPLDRERHRRQPFSLPLAAPLSPWKYRCYGEAIGNRACEIFSTCERVTRNLVTSPTRLPPSTNSLCVIACICPPPFLLFIINKSDFDLASSARLNIEQSIGQRFISKSEFFVNERFFVARGCWEGGVWISISRRICGVFRFAFYRGLSEKIYYWAKGILSRSRKRIGNLYWCK